MGRYVLAGWRSRVGAQLIDGLIIGVGALILFAAARRALGLAGASDSEAGIGAADRRPDRLGRSCVDDRRAALRAAA